MKISNKFQMIAACFIVYCLPNMPGTTKKGIAIKRCRYYIPRYNTVATEQLRTLYDNVAMDWSAKRKQMQQLIVAGADPNIQSSENRFLTESF